MGEDSSTTGKKKLLNIRDHLVWLRRGHDKFVGHLMLDTMQSRQHFKMRDEVSKSHLLQHSDYMMKLRPLMKRESGSDFHTTIWYNRYGKYGYEQRGLAAYVYS